MNNAPRVAVTIRVSYVKVYLHLCVYVFFWKSTFTAEGHKVEHILHTGVSSLETCPNSTLYSWQRTHIQEPTCSLHSKVQHVVQMVLLRWQSPLHAL